MAGAASVLIVDDNQDLREVLATLLEFEGHHVTQVANGQLAVDALASGPSFGVIILDLRMPVMDGVMFLEHKSRGPHAEVPVVIFTASLRTGLERFADVTAVVPKMAGIKGVVAAIHHAIGTSPALGGIGEGSDS
jgi:CheY-like chemotaxis protein